MYLCSLFVWVTLLCYHFTGADLCQLEGGQAKSSAANLTEVGPGSTLETEIITCPRHDDPPEWTACCNYTLILTNDSGSNPGGDFLNKGPCCHPNQGPILFYFISDQLALMIAASATMLLLIVTIVIVICCFWASCPLYMLCRVRYRQDDIIAYASKEDETTNLNDMPPEEQKGVTVYSPNAVKVTLKDDV